MGIECKIKSLDSRGNGVGRINEKIVFIPGGIPGDITEIEITKNLKNYSEGRIIRIKTPSPHRIKPECDKADICGGCSFWAMEYGQEIKHKKELVAESFIRLGGFERKHIENIISETVKTPSNTCYRNRVVIPVGKSDSGPIIGFFERGSHRIVDTDKCLLQNISADIVKNTIRDFVASDRICPDEGLLKSIEVRTGINTKQIMVILNLSRKETGVFKALIPLLEKDLKDAGYFLTSIYVNAKYGTKGKYMHIWGEKYIEEMLVGIKYKISPESFFQTNTKGAGILFEKSMEIAQLKGNETVYDLFCGLGALSLPVAKMAGKVIGIEYETAAIEDARENALSNNIKNVEFYAGKCEEVYPALLKEGKNREAVFLDPPRKGAPKSLLGEILSGKPEKIIYISCNPSTLARDCKILCSDSNYAINRIIPVDLFPRTNHVECVVLMSRVD